ncbi:molybdopterin synthase sulfur carrier subunit [Candidatus Acetothermia bacterium]|nr:MAG: molybdopterin synthase sulfur carrier subunit [Candidatus Acetothermia bacterium]
MKVTVLLFAALREAAGTSELELELADGTTISGLISRLERDHPGLAAHLPHAKPAVNRRLVDGATILHDGDEVAFLPPVGGG